MRTWWQMHLTTTLLLIAVLLLLLMTCSLLAKLRGLHSQPPPSSSGARSPRFHQVMWWIALGDPIRDDIYGLSPLGLGPYVLAPDESEFQRPPPSPPPISVDSSRVTWTPSRGLMAEILLDRTGQLSSRGSPRKGDYIAADAD